MIKVSTQMLMFLVRSGNKLQAGLYRFAITLATKTTALRTLPIHLRFPIANSAPAQRYSVLGNRINREQARWRSLASYQEGRHTR